MWLQRGRWEKDDPPLSYSLSEHVPTCWQITFNHGVSEMEMHVRWCMCAQRCTADWPYCTWSRERKPKTSWCWSDARLVGRHTERWGHGGGWRVGSFPFCNESSSELIQALAKKDQGSTSMLWSYQRVMSWNNQLSVVGIKRCICIKFCCIGASTSFFFFFPSSITTSSDVSSKLHVTSEWSHNEDETPPKALRHVTQHRTPGNLYEECSCSVTVRKAPVSHRRLTKGPYYFPGSDISQSAAHHCNRGLQGVSQGMIRGQLILWVNPVQRGFWRSDTASYRSSLHQDGG